MIGRFAALFIAFAVSLLAQSSAQSDPLQTLNDAFRQAYAAAKQRTLDEASKGPLILVTGDTATLIRDAKRVQANVNAPLYHSVKTIAHVPLAVFVALSPGEGSLDPDRRKTVEHLRSLIPPARAELDTIGLPELVLARQKQILTASTNLLDTVIARGSYTRKSLEAFTRAMAPLVLENAADATRAELDVLHAQVSAWRRDMPAAEWNALHVLIVGPHMPREDLVVTQYFSRLLHEPAEGRRIVYAEAQWTEPQALDTLAVHALDGSAGDAFFGDYLRMHRDLLGDAAREYLPRLLP